MQTTVEKNNNNNKQKTKQTNEKTKKHVCLWSNESMKWSMNLSPHLQ